MMNNAIDAPTRIVYWHRELPPLNATPIGEHAIEADSPRVPDTLAHRDDLWKECPRRLIAEVQLRVSQEVSRLEGRFAHVLDERIEIKRDRIQSEAWLHGRYTYMLYR